MDYDCQIASVGVPNGHTAWPETVVKEICMKGLADTRVTV